MKNSGNFLESFGFLLKKITIILFLIMYICVFCMGMYGCPESSEEGVWIPWRYSYRLLWATDPSTALGNGLGPCQEQCVFLTAECHSDQGRLPEKRMFHTLMAPLPPKMSTDEKPGAGQPPCKHESVSLKKSQESTKATCCHTVRLVSQPCQLLPGFL